VMSHSLIQTVTVVWPLEVSPLIDVARSLLHAKLVWHGCHLSTSAHRSVHSIVVHRTRPVLGTRTLVELESWL
jgi:hypothetical protein